MIVIVIVFLGLITAFWLRRRFQFSLSDIETGLLGGAGALLGLMVLRLFSSLLGLVFGLFGAVLGVYLLMRLYSSWRR